MWSAGRCRVQAHLALDSSARAVIIEGICQPSCHLGAWLHLSLPTSLIVMGAWFPRHPGSWLGGLDIPAMGHNSI